MGLSRRVLTFYYGAACSMSNALQFGVTCFHTAQHYHRNIISKQGFGTVALLSHRSQDFLDGRLVEGDACIGCEDSMLYDSVSRRRFLFQLSSLAFSASVLPVAVIADEDTEMTTTTNRLENLVKEAQDLDNELIQEEKDETKSIEDTKKLISEIEDEMKDPGDNASKKQEEEMKIISDTEALIKEQEKIKDETQAVITKIETMESEVKEFDENSTTTGNTKSGEFVNKLKQRVEEKEDLISKLKRESELYRDPLTGKFRPMTQTEFKKRAASTDYDYLQILKDSVTKNDEFEQDLEAFEGLLERNFGSIIKELKKDEDVVGDGFDRIKESAGVVFEQIRKLF
ncbi:hypothetical protein HJC23_010443 [Cyclotella cryptica]|uniref:Uncharacterized protein n=1 Tax=Cyclotella cryptica TaxID=29204 RepID=A0ABD3QH79_9STRA|eukprot:CCRYP_005320-RB/>CCRYP_005320-RB protein AED:0.01 eAED:0.01 QI:97/-1/1/1/-1/1/1/353/342